MPGQKIMRANHIGMRGLLRQIQFRFGSFQKIGGVFLFHINKMPDRHPAGTMPS